MKSLVKYVVAGSLLVAPSIVNGWITDEGNAIRIYNSGDVHRVIDADRYVYLGEITPNIFLSESVTERRYDIRIQPQDTWESLTEDIQYFEPETTIDKVVAQSFERNPLVLNLELGEMLFYFAKK